MATARPEPLRVLIIGGSRGIGAALVRQYAAAGWEVHATLRKLPEPGAPSDLPDGVHLHELDVQDKEQTAALAKSLDGKPLHLLIVSAGTFDRVGGLSGTGPEIPAAKVFDINAEAPIRVAEAVFPNLRAAAPSKMVFLSTAAATRSNGEPQGTYAQSKARLNDHIREYAGEWAWFGVIGIALHPGWVKTDMGGERAPVTPKHCAETIQKIVAGLTPDYCGTFLNLRGNILPW